MKKFFGVAGVPVALVVFGVSSDSLAAIEPCPPGSVRIHPRVGLEGQLQGCIPGFYAN
jgi:hypothetical protein